MLNLESVFSRTSSSLSKKAYTTKLCRAALSGRIGIDKTLSRRAFVSNRYRQNFVAPRFRFESVSTKLCRPALSGQIGIDKTLSTRPIGANRYRQNFVDRPIGANRYRQNFVDPGLK